MGEVRIFPGRRTKGRGCPTCGELLDAYSALGDSEEEPVPEPGDITMCRYCQTLLVFTEENFRVATQEEVARLPEVIREAIIALSTPPRETRH